VTVRGSNDIAVVDITDIRHPKTVSTLGQISLPRFVSATELSYLQDGALIRAPLSGSPKTIVSSQSVGIFAWSPDGNTAAYLTSQVFNETESKMELHLMSAGNDRVVGWMSGLPKVWGCETQACADTYDLHLSYSPDGRFISWAQNVRPVFRLWGADGRDVTPSTVVPFMTVWSDAGLYFGDSKGIEVYRTGVVSPFLPGATWIRPKASAGGGQILYEARDGSGLGHAYLADTTSGKARDLGQGRTEPQFLTSRYVWYQGERLCTATDQCAAGPATGTGKTYLYDLQDGTETESNITSVLDVWPHAA
jgi:hypothetical protein